MDDVAAAAPAPGDVDPDLAAEFNAALAADAQAPHSEAPAPPRKAVSADPDAPHGRDENGEPLAPYGLNKKTGKPNLKPAGPGRPKADKPRTVAAVKAPAGPQKAGAAQAVPDYSAELAGFATSVWMGVSALQGGKIPLAGVRLPDMRPFAYVFRQQTPQLVTVWNQAAQQSPAVRGWVEKMAGEGSWHWVIAVGVTSVNFLTACAEVAKKENAELRRQLAAANDAQMAELLGRAAAQAEAVAA